MPTREKFTIRNDAGDSVPLYYPAHLCVVQHDGLGMAPVQRTHISGPHQHGATQTHAKLSPRVVTLRLESDYESDESWAARQALIQMFNAPTGDPLHLDAVLPTGDTRRLNVRYMAGLTMPLQRGVTEAYAVQLIASKNPEFYDPTAILWGYSVPSGSSLWSFPLAFPAGFGAGSVDVTETKQYTGTWEVYPIITVVGPCTDLLIENETTDEKLDFDGHTIAAGETVTIDLIYGEKTVESSTDNTDVADLTTDSDIATWHIAPHCEAMGGQNTLHITFTGGTSNSQVSIQFNTRYLGI